MINLAGDLNCDKEIFIELMKAGIEIVKDNTSINGTEVPYRLKGKLHGWEFRRGWYYWIVTSDKGLDKDRAIELNDRLGEVIRIDGFAGGKSSKEIKGEVCCYNIDTQEGLNEFAKFIKGNGMEINAQNMRILCERDSQELESLLRIIEIEAEKGNSSVFQAGAIKDTSKKSLESRGFKVEIGGRYNERDTYISW